MTDEHETIRLDGRTREAVEELQQAITQRYPGTSFSLSHPEDEPTSIQVTAVVDVDDPDEVLDLVIDRVVDLQVDEGLPIHVVPVRTPERIAAYMQERRAAGRYPLRHSHLLA